jgi:hypothetical protein
MKPADRSESFYMRPERYIDHVTELEISQPIREQLARHAGRGQRAGAAGLLLAALTSESVM